MSACGLCGHTPACGSAEIDGTRYCHGDCPHEDATGVSCYEWAEFGLADPTLLPRIRLFRHPKETR